MTRWITEKLGTAAFSAVAPEPDIAIIDVRELVDGFGNDPASVASLIEKAVGALEENRRVIVCCGYGISRSNAIAAGALCIKDKIPFSQAVERVVTSTGEQNIRLEMLDAVRKACVLLGTPGPAGPDAGGKILVLGTDGLARAAISALGADYSVVVPQNVDAREARNPIALEQLVHDHQIKTILHLALPRVRNLNTTLGESILLLKNVVDLCRISGARLLMRSDAAVFSGYAGLETMIGDHTMRTPGGIWGEAMHQSECLLEQARQSWGLNYTALRTSTIFTDQLGSPAFLSEFIDKARCASPIVHHMFENGCARVNFIHRSDVVLAIVAVIKHRELTGGINVVSEHPVAVDSLARYIVDKLNSKSEISTVPVKRKAPAVNLRSDGMKQVANWVPGTDIFASLDICLKEIQNREGI